MAEAKKTIRFPTYNITLGDAILIVKYHLDDPEIALQSKVLAIDHVANMPTHNSVSKDEIIRALRWLYENYEF